MRLPPQSSSVPQQQQQQQNGSLSAVTAPPHSFLPSGAPSSRPSTPSRRSYERPIVPTAPSSRPVTPQRVNNNNLQEQSTSSRSWNVIPRDPSPSSDNLKQPPPTSPSSAGRAINHSPKLQRVLPVVQQKQPPPQQSSSVVAPGPSPTDYFRSRVKRQSLNGTTNTISKQTMEPESETTKAPSGNNSSTTTKSNSSSSNSGVIPSSFPRTAPNSSKNKISSSNLTSPPSFTPTTSAFKAARNAFTQSNVSSSGNSSTEPEQTVILRKQEPEASSFSRRQNFATYGKNSSVNNDQGKQAIAGGVTPPVDVDIKPQLSSAMKQVDSYYKKFLAQELGEEDAASRTSTAVTNTDVRDELLERLQHEYVTHTQQISSLQQQLEQEITEKNKMERNFFSENKQLQTNISKAHRQLEEQRIREENRVSELEQMCQMMQKELEEKRRMEEQKSEEKRRLSELEELCHMMQKELEEKRRIEEQQWEEKKLISDLEQMCLMLQKELEEKNLLMEQRSAEENRISELENMCDMLQKELEEEQHQKDMLQSQFKAAIEQQCVDLREDLEERHLRKYRELELTCQDLKRQLHEQHEVHNSKEVAQVAQQESQDKQREEQVLRLQKMLKEEKDSRKLSERQVKKQAEEKYHELLLTCNSLREELLATQQGSKDRSTPAASDDIEHKLTAEIKMLKGELQQMTEKLELCREPQAVGDIKAMYESIILDLEREKEDFNQRLQTLEHTNSKLKMLIKDEANAIGGEMVKLLNEDGETAGIMELEEEFCRAHSENQAILQAMPDVTKTKPANLTPDGKVKVDPEKLVKMKQQLIDLRVANARYEKQIAFVKGICDQVVESVRQELNDVETEKANFEKDLISQLAEMARSKAAIEEDFTAKLSVSEQMITSLKRKLEMGADSPSMASAGSDVMGSSDKLANLEKEKDKLKRVAKEQENKIHELTSKLEAAKKGTSNIAAIVPTQHQQELAKLESDVRELHKKLEFSEEKVSELRQTASEQKQIISTLSADLKMVKSKKNCSKGRSTNADEAEITDYLSRVSNINDQTNSSMEVLDAMLKQIKALEEINENNSTYPYILSNDTQEFISLLTKSKQVREEIKMSLYLIELNFMNQLESIRQERHAGASSIGQTNLEGRDVSTSFDQKSLQIKKEVRLSLHKTEQDLLSKIASFESEVKKKEDVAKQLRKTCAEQEHAIKEARTKQKLSCSGASKILLNTLNREVHTTVEKLREKEEEVNSLNSQLDELRQELNEVIKEKDHKIETLESLTKETEEKMKILKGSFSFSDDEVSADAPKVKPSPFFGTGHNEFYINSGFQDSPDIGYF